MGGREKRLVGEDSRAPWGFMKSSALKISNMVYEREEEEASPARVCVGLQPR